MSEKMWVNHFRKMSQGQIPRQQRYYMVESYKSDKESAKPQVKKRKTQPKKLDLFAA